MINVYKRGKTDNYVYVDSETNTITATYGEHVEKVDLRKYTLVDTSKPPRKRTPENQLKVYKSAIKSGHPEESARIISGYTGE